MLLSLQLRVIQYRVVIKGQVRHSYDNNTSHYQRNARRETIKNKGHIFKFIINASGDDNDD